MYTRYFGFRESPFSVAPDPRFYYSNPVYDEAYANLLYGIRERKGFILMTGEIGTGKTTVLRRVMENLEATTPFVFLFNTNLSFDDMLAFICDELGIAVKGNGRLRRLQALNEFLLEQLRHGRTTALLIDEAQDLRDSVLEDIRLISNLEGSGEKLLQIVLVGQPELEAKLAQPSLRQLRQRIAVRSRLDCLKPREVGAFILHRLRQVGCTSDDLFTPEAITLVARYSRGVPRLVNVICDNALLITYAASKRHVNAEIVAEVSQDLRLGEEEGVKPQVVGVGLDSAFKDLEQTAARMADANGPKAGDLAFAAIVLLLLVLGGAVAVYSSQSSRPAILPWLANAAERATTIARSSFEGPNPVERSAAGASALVPAPRKAVPAEREPEEPVTAKRVTEDGSAADPGEGERTAAPWKQVPSRPDRKPIEPAASAAVSVEPEAAPEPESSFAPPAKPAMAKPKARAVKKRATVQRSRSRDGVSTAPKPPPAAANVATEPPLGLVEEFAPEPRTAKRRNRGVLGDCINSDLDSCSSYKFSHQARGRSMAGGHRGAGAP